MLMYGVTALALAGCTKSEVLDINEGRAIGFDAYTGKGTRAVNDITGSGDAQGFKAFYVYASYSNSNGTNEILTNEAVTYDGSWKYTNTQYWMEGSYKFVAYSDGNSQIVNTEGGNDKISYSHSGGLVIKDYVVSNKDLLFANADKSVSSVDLQSNINPVNLTLSHLLSKVRFTFTETFADNLTVEVSDLKIINSKTKGTYKYDTDAYAYEWEIGTDTKEITYKTPVVVSASYTPEECYVLPQSTNGLTASFTVTVKDALDAVVMSKEFTGSAAVSLNVTNATEWNNGYAYNYTAELTPALIDPDAKPIQFTAEAKTWTENNNGNGTPIIP